jgi:hypothetical protein
MPTAAAPSGGPPSTWTTSATCKSGTSWRGSTRPTDSDEGARALVRKGRGFSEDDKAVLRAVELSAEPGHPEHREAAARGKSRFRPPFYHPILPLLATATVLRTHPRSPMPRERFSTRRMPPCSSNAPRLSPAALWRRPTASGRRRICVGRDGATGGPPPASRDGNRRTDTGATLEMTFTRDQDGRLGSLSHCMFVYRHSFGGGCLACVRDHALSDLIGFSPVARRGGRRRLCSAHPRSRRA